MDIMAMEMLFITRIKTNSLTLTIMLVIILIIMRAIIHKQ